MSILAWAIGGFFVVATFGWHFVSSFLWGFYAVEVDRRYGKGSPERRNLIADRVNHFFDRSK